MSQQSPGPWRQIRSVGMVLFLLGFGTFVAVPLLGGFQIDDTVLAELRSSGAIAGHHVDAVEAELRTVADRRFSTVFTFVPTVGQLLEQANEQVGGSIYEYDRGQYAMRIAKAANGGPVPGNELNYFLGTFVLASLGALLYFLPRIKLEPAGIKNDGNWFSGVKSRGLLGIAFGTFLILLYIGLYFAPAYITGWIRLTDPLSRALNGNPASQWFFYGLLYTFCVGVMGVRMMVHYRHSPYHLIRTASIIFFQTGFAFLIPELLSRLSFPWYDYKNAWPLDYDYFHDWSINGFWSAGIAGKLTFVWGIALAILLVPVLAAFFGKRWYCSWVCGCGGLAETLGDPFRHLSDKSLRAWKVERYLIHGVLVFVVIMTGMTLANYISDGSVFGASTYKVQKWYGFLIGSVFAGVVGTGFYPFLGNRVWCRFGCPLAAILGMVQKFKSRFRITTNGGQCISCGNCSTYCEMGIDVRWYAQRGQNIIRSSCVGCGVCAAVCPRGVLRLENGPIEGRYNETSLLQLGGGSVDGL